MKTIPDNMQELISCAIKIGTIRFVTDEADKLKTLLRIADYTIPIINYRLSEKMPNDIEVDMLKSESYREYVESAVKEALCGIADNNEYNAIITHLQQKYIEPDDTLHLCVGFYPNGQFKTNTIKGKNLPNNIEYNRFMRPGRFYFVDGEYVCGGMLKPKYMEEQIATFRQKIRDLNLQPARHDTAPYE